MLICTELYRSRGASRRRRAGRPHRRSVASVAVLAVSLVAATAGIAAASPPTATAPTVTFTLLTPLPTHLAIGETAVIGVRVESSQPFAMAIALSDAYYPGRGVRFNGSSAQANATAADLYLTITGTQSTAELPEVRDWPADAPTDWATGVAPLIVRVGARFAGGQVVSTAYLFGVQVS